MALSVWIRGAHRGLRRRGGLRHSAGRIAWKPRRPEMGMQGSVQRVGIEPRRCPADLDVVTQDLAYLGRLGDDCGELGSR